MSFILTADLLRLGVFLLSSSQPTQKVPGSRGTECKEACFEQVKSQMPVEEDGKAQATYYPP